MVQHLIRTAKMDHRVGQIRFSRILCQHGLQPCPPQGDHEACATQCHRHRARPTERHANDRQADPANERLRATHPVR